MSVETEVKDNDVVEEKVVEEPATKTEVKEEKKEEKIDYKEMFNGFMKEYVSEKEKKQKEEVKEEPIKKEEKETDPMDKYMKEMNKTKVKQLDYHLEKICLREEFPEQFKTFLKYDSNTTEKELEAQIETFRSALNSFEQSIIDEKKSGGSKLGGNLFDKKGSGSKGKETQVENYGAMIAQKIYGGGKK